MLSAWFAWMARWWRWLLVLQIVSGGWWLLSQGITAEAQVRHRAEKFRRALAAKDSTRAWDMVSPRYTDSWGLTRDDLRLALKDVTSQFIVLNVEWVDPHLETSAGSATLTARSRVSGSPFNPVGQFMLQTASRLESPFVFRWEKEGWWPWTWRLVSISNPGLELPPEYQPGMLSGQSAGLESALQRAVP